MEAVKLGGSFQTHQVVFQTLKCHGNTFMTCGDQWKFRVMTASKCKQGQDMMRILHLSMETCANHKIKPHLASILWKTVVSTQLQIWHRESNYDLIF